MFLVVSFPHPHAPYDPPEPYASMFDPAESVLPEVGQSRERGTADGVRARDDALEHTRRSREPEGAPLVPRDRCEGS